MTAFYRIPFTPPAAWVSKPVTIQDTTYTFEFYYNARQQRWYLDIQDIAEQPLLLGIPLLIDRNLTGQYATFCLPKADLAVIDSSGQGNEATLQSFALNHQLIFADYLQ